MKKTWLLLVLMPIIVGCTQSTTPKASTETSESLEIPECVGASPPDSLQLDPFYKKYVDVNGKPTMDIRYNPNTSMAAIEGITSPDGRILGKMGHSERKGTDICKNVPGAKDQHIFENGVKYFL